jgi:hypothetical protein
VRSEKRPSPLTSHFSSLCALLLALVALGGLQGGGSAAAAPQGNSQLRVVHAVPGVPLVDVLVDGAVVWSGLAFGADSGYLVVPAGARAVAVAPSGAGALAARVRAEIALGAGEARTVIAGGAPDGVLVLADVGLAPLGAPALVRLAHAAPGAPLLELAVEGGPSLADAVAFGQASPYRDATPGAMTLVLRPRGAPTAVASIPGAVLVADRAYTFVALGAPDGGPPLAVLALVDG